MEIARDQNAAPVHSASVTCTVRTAWDVMESATPGEYNPEVTHG